MNRNERVTARLARLNIAALMIAAGLAVPAVGSSPASSDCVGSATVQVRPFRASTFKQSGQEQVVVASLGQGDQQQLITAWSSRRQQAGRSGVYFQRFTADGSPVGSEMRLAEWPESHQRSPAVSTIRDGAIAAWQSWGQDGDAGAIIARRFTFDPTAEPSAQLTGGDEVLINQSTGADQTRPMIAVSADDRVLFAWSSATADGAGSTIKARVFDAQLSAISPEIDLLAGEDASVISAAMASVASVNDPTGNAAFAVALATTCGGLPDGIRIQMLDSAGQPVGTPALLGGGEGAGLAQRRIEPVLAAAPCGLITAWAQAEEATAGAATAYRVFVQRLDHHGHAIDDPTPVAGPSGEIQNAPAIEVNSDGSFVVAFNQADGDGNGVMVRRFDASGRAEGEPFLAHATSAGEQQLELSGVRRSVVLSDGRIALAWTGDAQSGDKNSANITLLGGAEISASAEMGVTADMLAASFTDGQIRSEAEMSAAEPHIPPTFDRTAIDRSPRTITKSGRAIGFDAVLNTGWTPPDPHMAVGPSHVVVMTNGAIAFFRKSDGFKTFQDEIEDSFGFWGGQGATGFVFDPEVLYDETTGRFFAMAAEANAPPNQTKSYVLIAVSDDSDPNGTWFKYRLDTSALAGNLFDSPNIGVSNDVVLITGDGFGAGTNYPVYTLRKSDMLAGLPTSFVRSTTLATSTQSAGIPPVSYDSPPAIYMLEHQEGSNRTQLRLIALTNPFTGPTFTTFNLTVPTYSAPGDPVQMGTSSRPESFDARFWSVAFRNGKLWGTHHINSTVQARWYEIATNNWPTSGAPTLVQSGLINPGAGINTSFSAITATASGHAAMTYAYSSSSNFLSMATSHRLYCDAPGTMRAPVIHKVSTAAYTSGRWGDYSAVQTDPVDVRKFWAVHEYAIGGSWRTWVQSIDRDLCPDECPADFDGSGFVDTDDYDAFVEAFEAGTDDADFDGSGFVDTDDFDAFVEAFEAGC
ncbi:MAG: hypothetical protein IT435_15120 [Phycisphaerales bacterium]|nr:hypothetical protein [Phycisphaerales bacterium]